MRQFLALFLALGVLGVRGQTAGEITGEVRDPAGAAVAGASVIVTNRDTNLTRSTVTTGVGVYSFPALQPGFYSVRVEMRGFSAAIRSDIEVQVQQSPG